jgi:hypothetical protein
VAAIIALVVGLFALLFGGNFLNDNSTFVFIARIQSPQVTPTAILQPTNPPILAPTEIPAIAALDLHTEVKNGVEYTSARMSSAALIGNGRFTVTAPITLTVHDSADIRLIVAPDTASLPTNIGGADIAVTGTSTPTIIPPNTRVTSEQISVYTQMTAELIAAPDSWSIAPTGPQTKLILSDKAVEWAWIVTPKVDGDQALSLEISVPVVLDRANNIGTMSPLSPQRIAVHVNSRGLSDAVASALIWASATIIAALIGLLVIKSNKGKSSGTKYPRTTQPR